MPDKNILQNTEKHEEQKVHESDSANPIMRDSLNNLAQLRKEIQKESLVDPELQVGYMKIISESGAGLMTNLLSRPSTSPKEKEVLKKAFDKFQIVLNPESSINDAILAYEEAQKSLKDIRVNLAIGDFVLKEQFRKHPDGGVYEILPLKNQIHPFNTFIRKTWWSIVDDPNREWILPVGDRIFFGSMFILLDDALDIVNVKDVNMMFDVDKNTEIVVNAILTTINKADISEETKDVFRKVMETAQNDPRDDLLPLSRHFFDIILHEKK